MPTIVSMGVHILDVLTFTPDDFATLNLDNPDLWWPYTLGRPDLYDLRLDFLERGTVTTTATQRS
jgi:exo-1,4-beta-D-glucosaminidase